MKPVRTDLNLEQTIDELRAGRVAWRPDWGEDVTIKIDTDRTPEVLVRSDDPKAAFSMTAKDMLASDWSTADDPAVKS